jgi:hypothetical protein
LYAEGKSNLLPEFEKAHSKGGLSFVLILNKGGTEIEAT